MMYEKDHDECMKTTKCSQDHTLIKVARELIFQKKKWGDLHL